jgi:thiamine biosynthesis lipoprotein
MVNTAAWSDDLMEEPFCGFVAETIARVEKSARVTVDDGLCKLAFHAMSTHCRVCFHALAESTAYELGRDIIRWSGEFEARYSRFIPGSLVSQINRAAGQNWVEIDAQTELILDRCQELFAVTLGAFDPTVLPLIELWNWKADPPVLPSESVVESVRELVGWEKIQRRPGEMFLPRKGMRLDLGGIGKEYAVDCVLKMIIQGGAPNALVDFGQDIRVFGHAPGKQHWLIGLEDARQPGSCWAGVAVTNQAVASSGDYQRHFQLNGHRYGHILDPRTGYPVQNEVRAVSIIAPDCTFAGLLSTSACVLGSEQAMALMEKQPGVAGAITTDKTRLFSSKFREFIPA